MSPISRPRRRPRDSSVNFRTLWWVLQREAALAVLYHDVLDTPMETIARNHVAVARTDHLRALVRAALAVRDAPPHYPSPFDIDGELHTAPETLHAEQIPLIVVPPAGFAGPRAATTERPTT